MMRLQAAGVQISMDGRGRVFDNIFVERLWRSVKYERLYLYDYDTVPAVTAGLAEYFVFYNTERPHQSLGYHAGRGACATLRPGRPPGAGIPA